jgi:hypothetical protein
MRTDLRIMSLSSTAKIFEIFGDTGITDILDTVVLGVISSTIDASPLRESSTVNVSSLTCAKTGCRYGRIKDWNISVKTAIAIAATLGNEEVA